MFTPGPVQMMKELIVSSINSENNTQGKCIVSTIFSVSFVT